MYFFLGTHTEPLGAQTLNEKQFINLLWTADSDSLMQRSNALCFKHHHSEKGTRTATFRMPSDSAGILIGMTATRALISLGMIQSGLTGILSSWDAVKQEICADVFLQDGGIGSASSGHGTKFQILPCLARACREAAAAAPSISAWTCVQLLTKQTKIKCLQSVWMLISQIVHCFV